MSSISCANHETFVLRYCFLLGWIHWTLRSIYHALTNILFWIHPDLNTFICSLRDRGGELALLPLLKYNDRVWRVGPCRHDHLLVFLGVVQNYCIIILLTKRTIIIDKRQLFCPGFCQRFVMTSLRLASRYRYIHSCNSLCIYEYITFPYALKVTNFKTNSIKILNIKLKVDNIRACPEKYKKKLCEPTWTWSNLSALVIFLVFNKVFGVSGTRNRN